MAIGNPPKHVITFSIPNLNEKQILALAMKTIGKLGWSVKLTSTKKITAYSKSSSGSTSEKINLILKGGEITIASASSGNKIIDWGNNKKNTEEFSRIFHDLKGKYSPEELDIVHNDVTAETKPLVAFEKNELGELANEGQIEDGSIFFPRKGYFFTPILMYVNILVFITMILSGVGFMEPTSESLLEWGANFRPLTVDGEIWRLFTSFFIHIGLIHILFNMYALLFIGMILEPNLGRLKFISAYLATGIISSAMSLIWNDLTVSAGASGAIFGLYGVFLALLATKMVNQKDSKALSSSILFFIGYNLFYGFTSEGIDNAAHVGGLLSGLLIGFAFYPSLKNPGHKKTNYASVIIIATITLVFGLVATRQLTGSSGNYKDLIQNESSLKKFIELQDKAMAFYHLPINSTNYDCKIEIEKGIEVWKECISLLKKSNKLDLPDTETERNSKLIECCELRIKCYGLIYQAITNDTEEFNTDIKKCNDKIDAIIDELNNDI